MRRTIFIIITTMIVSFAAGYEVGDSKTADPGITKFNNGSVCPYLRSNPSASSERECPYLNKNKTQENKCPYSDGKIQKSGSEKRLLKSV